MNHNSSSYNHNKQYACTFQTSGRKPDQIACFQLNDQWIQLSLYFHMIIFKQNSTHLELIFTLSVSKPQINYRFSSMQHMNSSSLLLPMMAFIKQFKTLRRSLFIQINANHNIFRVELSAGSNRILRSI